MGQRRQCRGTQCHGRLLLQSPEYLDVFFKLQCKNVSKRNSCNYYLVLLFSWCLQDVHVVDEDTLCLGVLAGQLVVVGGEDSSATGLLPQVVRHGVGDGAAVWKRETKKCGKWQHAECKS